MDYFDPDDEGDENERPKAKQKRPSWESSVSFHDHVGSMSFDGNRAVCRECGQTWGFSKPPNGGWTAGHFPGGLSRKDVVEPVRGRKPKTPPVLNMAGRGTRENDETIWGVVLRWEEEGLLSPGWRVGPSSSAA